jgi:hypothetical protein
MCFGCQMNVYSRPYYNQSTYYIACRQGPTPYHWVIVIILNFQPDYLLVEFRIRKHNIIIIEKGLEELTQGLIYLSSGDCEGSIQCLPLTTFRIKHP